MNKPLHTQMVLGFLVGFLLVVCFSIVEFSSVSQSCEIFDSTSENFWFIARLLSDGLLCLQHFI